jgi:thymidylate kinase
MRLRTIAAIGKKDGARGGNEQSSRAAGKSTQIVEIREMRHQQYIQIVLFEARSKATQATSVIHREKCSKKREAGLRKSKSQLDAMATMFCNSAKRFSKDLRPAN